MPWLSRRMFRFSLRSMLIGLTFSTIWFGVHISRVHNRHRSLSRLEERNEAVLRYSNESLTMQVGADMIRYAAEPLGPWWVRTFMGEEYCRKVRILQLMHPDKELIRELKYFPEIEILVVIPGSQLTDEGLQHVGELKNLKLLSIKHGREISNDGLSCVGRLTELKELRLEGLAVDDDVLDLIGKLPQLERLFTKQTLITREGIEMLGKALPNLETEFHHRVISPSLFP